MKAAAGSFTFFRQTKPSARWADPQKPEHDPSWVVSINMPGHDRDRRMRPHLPVCEGCLAYVGNPAKDRPNCECVKAVVRWAKEELLTRTHLMQTGKIQELQAMRTPKKLASPQEVMQVVLERGPGDRRARVNSLKNIFEQATGRLAETMRWEDLTEDLVITWAEMRQEAGRRGWLGLINVRDLPEDGWQQLRDLKAAGKLPALDKRKAAPWNTSILGYFTKAKTIFGKESRQSVLRGMHLPELKEFMEVSVKVKTMKGHKAIGADPWMAMIEADAALKAENLRVWVVHQLLLRLSCRPKEVRAAKPGWLQRVGSRTRILIVNREDEKFTLKAGEGATERAIWLPDDLVQAIEEVSTPESLIGAKHKTDARIILGEHSAWMRRFVPTGTQTSYLLRHSGAAERMTSGDSTKAAALLGHKTTQMVETTYGAVLETLEPISDDEILRRVG